MEMRSFSEFREALTALQGAAPSYTELKGVAFQYDGTGIQETGEAGPPRMSDKTRIVGRYDPQSETVAIIVPQRLSRQYNDTAITTYIETVVVPDLRKKYSFRKYFIYR